MNERSSPPSALCLSSLGFFFPRLCFSRLLGAALPRLMSWPFTQGARIDASSRLILEDSDWDSLSVRESRNEPLGATPRSETPPCRTRSFEFLWRPPNS